MLLNVLIALIFLPSIVDCDCFNAEYGLTGLGNDEDTCFVMLVDNKVSAGYVDKSIEKILEETDVVPCYLIEEIFEQYNSTFACNCTGMICNGHALMQARHAIGMMVDKAPSDRDW
ncbi:hypothetical protein PRIPAC_95742 [Pristionchus pacificus]|uniref:Uncharacterized protein n=1 Tax=Pristionchus pacificus TaxID=54126 RepID=A0A454XLE2_PRIPA|nr:hypothetical protein PRIPAC_95742 [Pristionchus pacificus]|eukprot:PDM84044.1 hypothetical protein PRIPAC_34236 [Pristionchus pacificus]